MCLVGLDKFAQRTAHLVIIQILESFRSENSPDANWVILLLDCTQEAQWSHTLLIPTGETISHFHNIEVLQPTDVQ